MTDLTYHLPSGHHLFHVVGTSRIDDGWPERPKHIEAINVQGPPGAFVGYAILNDGRAFSVQASTIENALVMLMDAVCKP